MLSTVAYCALYCAYKLQYFLLFNMVIDQQCSRAYRSSLRFGRLELDWNKIQQSSLSLSNNYNCWSEISGNVNYIMFEQEHNSFDFGDIILVTS